MQLHELKFGWDREWSTSLTIKDGILVRAYRTHRNGSWLQPDKYAIQRTYDGTWWRDLEPIEAQAVLYHLTSEVTPT